MSSVQLVDITKLALGSNVFVALIGLDPLTGCHTLGACAGQGKMKALAILLRYQKFIDVFTPL